MANPLRCTRKPISLYNLNRPRSAASASEAALCASNTYGAPMTASREKTEPRKLPIPDMVIFPYMMTPFVVGRECSVCALEEAPTGDR